MCLRVVSSLIHAVTLPVTHRMTLWGGYRDRLHPSDGIRAGQMCTDTHTHTVYAYSRTGPGVYANSLSFEQNANANMLIIIILGYSMLI